MNNIVQDKNQQLSQGLPIQIQKSSSLYTFKITQEIVQTTRKSIQQISTIIQNQPIQLYYKIKGEQKQVKTKILISCLSKDHRTQCRYNDYGDLYSNFFKQIVHVKFTNVTSLNLNSNRISNLQDLQFLNAPSVRIFQLHTNNLVRIGALFKNTNMKQLHSLTLQRNYIKQINTISRALFANLGYMQLQTSTNYEPSIQDLFFTIKLQSSFTTSVSKKLWASSKKRINQQKILKIMNFNLTF